MDQQRRGRLPWCSAAGLAALLALAAVPAAARAASCCGGGGGGGVVVPKGSRALLDLAVETERYDGFWDVDGTHRPDPPGSDLAQHRVSLAAGWRFGPRWQVGLAMPYVWNDNVYSGISSQTNGLGDGTLTVLFDAWSERSIWKVLSPADLLPSVTVGAALTIPTGLSPYDDVQDSLDITGRGFYRLDGTLTLDKTYRGFSSSLALAYGVHLERPVNRYYALYVEPYDKRLGNRFSASLSAGYRFFIGSAGDSITATGALSYLREGDFTVNGTRQADTGLYKTAFAATVLWAGTDRDWSLRGSWAHAFQFDDWGTNFPTTDTFTLGVRYAIR